MLKLAKLFLFALRENNIEHEKLCSNIHTNECPKFSKFNKLDGHKKAAKDAMKKRQYTNQKSPLHTKKALS